MDTVRAIRAPRDDLVQEHHPVFGFADRHVVVAHPRQQVAELGQLVVVGGKQGARAQARVVVDVFDHRPGDRQAVVGARAAPDFVQHQQRARGGVVEDVRCLDHLHHKGRLPGVDLVLGADARENAVHQADARLGSRHKAAHLRHQRDQGHLAQEGALARHIGAGDQAHDLAFLKYAVVGHETFGAHAAFDHRVAPIPDFENGIGGDLRAGIAVQGGCLRQRGQHIQLRQGAGRVEQHAAGIRDLRTHLAENAGFDLVDALLGIQHQGFIFFHLRGDKAFGVDQGLFADIFGRRAARCAAADLDVSSQRPCCNPP